jgi:hypothetical protein
MLLRWWPIIFMIMCYINHFKRTKQYHLYTKSSNSHRVCLLVKRSPLNL